MNAYVTIISTDNFLPGALVMYESLKATGATSPFYLLLTGTVSQTCEAQARAYGISVIRDDENLALEMSRDMTVHRWQYTFDKFKIFRLTQFEKIVFLDSDMWINENLDSLFEWPDFSAVESEGGSPFLGNRKYFNSGLMTVEPSKQKFDRIMDLAPEIIRQYQQHGLALGDQNILNHFVPDWPDCPELRLPDGYNVFWGSLDRVIRNDGLHIESKDDESRIKVLHFTGKRKPWIEPRVFALLSLIRPVKNDVRLPSVQGIRLLRKYARTLRSVKGSLH